jgi:uncharacterized protein YjbJ (UPF0337 family)
MDQQTISGKWQEIKGEIRTQWAKLTDDDLEKAKGNVESIAGLIQQKYGHAKEATKEKLNELMGRYSTDIKQSMDELKHGAADATERAKRDLRENERDTKH